MHPSTYILLSSSRQGSKQGHFLGRYAGLWLGPSNVDLVPHPIWVMNTPEKKAYQTSNILPLFIHE